MKTCQNCKARSKDDVIECLHCGNPFGDAPKSEAVLENASETESEVKQTLFGIPAQKLEDLLTARDEAEEEDSPSKTMAGFNVAGLFGDIKEKEVPVAKNPNDLPKIIEDVGPQKTMASLNVGNLFKKTEEVQAKEEAPEKKREDAKFGTMLGINVADIMALSRKTDENESSPQKTLFSLPAVESLDVSTLSKPVVAGQAPDKPTGSKVSSGTAMGGVSAAVRSGSEAEPAFQTRTPKVSLGSLIPKVPLQKTKAPIVPARLDIPTPVEFAKQGGSDEPSLERQTASGILRKSKPSSGQKSVGSKKKSSVMGSYSVPKESLSSETSIPHDTGPRFPKSSVVDESFAEKQSPKPVKTAKTEDIPPKTDAKTTEKNASELAQSKPSFNLDDKGSATVDHIEVSKPGIETKQNVQKDEGKPNHEGSVKTIQAAFVIFGVLIILVAIALMAGAIDGFLVTKLSSIFNLLSLSLVTLSMVGSLGVLFTSKNAVIKGTVWMISAVILFLVGVLGIFINTPLFVLFIFAGALFLLSSLFPKIISIL